MRNVLLLLMLIVFSAIYGQTVPSNYENIAHLMTFGPGADVKWGDDDNTQIYFFTVPKSFKKNIYIRVLDPSTSGEMDQANGSFDTRTEFAVYGGRGAYSNDAARNMNPIKGFDSGILLDRKVFGSESKYDNEYYTFGPFNPKEGEYIPPQDDKDDPRYYFKIIIKGISGNDGNGYKLELSTSPDRLIPIEPSEAFSYEISFRLKEQKGSENIAHFYPFIEKGVTNVKQSNFDFDSNGKIFITSVVKNMHLATSSGDGVWQSSIHPIKEEEHNSVLDVQIVKNSDSQNDMVIFMENQYGEALPFYSLPSGYLKKYKYKVKITID